MVAGCMNIVKYMLFCFNLLFAISGIAIFTVGGIIYFAYADYSNFLNESYKSAPFVLMIVGLTVFVVAFFGCCGAVKESTCMIIVFLLFLVIILIAEIIAGVFIYVQNDDVEIMLKNKLNDTMFAYYSNEDYKNTWDIAQHEMECCGINGPSDWTLVNKNISLPHTCCPNTPEDGTCTIDYHTKYESSCFEKLKEIFLGYRSVIMIIILCIGIFQVLGVIFSSTLARSFCKEYEIV